MRKVWIFVTRTESGDDVGPYVWDHEPTEEEVWAVLNRDIPDEVEAECVEAGSAEECTLED